MGEKKSLDKSLRKCWYRVVKKHKQLSCKLNFGRLGALEVKVAHSASEWRQAKAVLGREHGLGAGREAGDRLCQLVREDGRLVAVLVWCAAAWHLQARDETVGWDAVTRSKRLKLEFNCGAFWFWKPPGGRTWPASAWERGCVN